MDLKAVAAVALCAASLAGVAEARDYTLNCVMTDYGQSTRAKDITQLVPPKSTHKVRGGDADIVGTGMQGSAEDTGSRLKLRYVGELAGVGEVEVVYTYVKSTGLMIAKTRAMRTVVWDDFPERSAKYIINGACTEK